MTEVPLGELRPYERQILLSGGEVSIVFYPGKEGNNTPLGVRKNVSWFADSHVLQEERIVSGELYTVGFLLKYFFAGVIPSYTITIFTKTPFTNDFLSELRAYSLDQPDQDILSLLNTLSMHSNG